MAAEKKVKKDKEIVLELEIQIKDIRQQLSDQLRCFDQHLDCHVAMLLDLQEYYRRHAEVEGEFSRNLDKLAKQLSVRQKKDPQSSAYSTHTTWQMLMDSTRQQSKNHGFLGEIFSLLIVNKLMDLQDDIQRIQKRCREMMTNHQEELCKVLTELETAMKTYHTYHGDSQQAETKLLRVQSQRVRVDQQNAISKRFINYDKKAEQKQAKYMENKLKALKARNEYLLCIDSANAALHKYFLEDFPKLVQKMYFGYHMNLTQTENLHITATNCVLNNDQERMNAFINQSKNIVASNDNSNFRSLYPKLFVKPEDFEFQPHRGDEICQISAQKPVQNDMLTRVNTMKERIDSNKKENEERQRNMDSIEQEILGKISQPDIDILQIYKDEKTGLKSPTEKEKRREERLKQEEQYIQIFHNYMKTDSLIVRLNSKFLALSKALGEGNYEMVQPGARPPSLPPKPKKLVKKPGGSQPKLFGGTIEEYVEATGTQIPIVVRSCIRIINLYGMHHQGIFRVSGSQNDINNYKQQFERGIDPLTSKVEGDDINSVAGLLKLYFRELKESLFPQEKFQALITNSEKFSGNEEECKAELRTIVSSLPRPRTVVMRYLFAFLNHLSEFSDENMMDAYNLAICFGPTLLPSPVTSDLCNHVYVNKLIENIIVHHEDIFPNDGDVVYERCIVECYGEKEFLDSVSDDDLLNSNIPDEDDDIEDHEAIAEYDYQGRSKNELSFRKGDVLMLFSRMSHDWWSGEYMGQKGLIPDKFIQPVKKRPSNLKKGCIQAKSSDCLLSPDDPVSSSSSSLDRCVSQPNVAVPVPSLPQLGIPSADLLNASHSLPIPDDKDQQDSVILSIDSALAKVHDSTQKLKYCQTLAPSPAQPGLSTSESDLDVLIPVQVHPPSPSIRGSLGVSPEQPKPALATFGNVRKSTSFRSPNESGIAKQESKMRHATDDAICRSSDQVDTLDRAISLLPVVGGSGGSGKNTSKSSTLPPNLPPPHFGMQSASGFDPEMLEDGNQFSTFPRSAPGDKRVPPVKPRPPAKKSSDVSSSSSQQ